MKFFSWNTFKLIVFLTSFWLLRYISSQANAKVAIFSSFYDVFPLLSPWNCFLLLHCSVTAYNVWFLWSDSKETRLNFLMMQMISVSSWEPRKVDKSYFAHNTHTVILYSCYRWFWYDNMDEGRKSLYNVNNLRCWLLFHAFKSFWSKLFEWTYCFLLQLCFVLILLFFTFLSLIQLKLIVPLRLLHFKTGLRFTCFILCDLLNVPFV